MIWGWLAVPNPLVQTQQNTGQPVQNRPVPEAPDLEHYAGHNNPYRGIEPHGVEPVNDPYDVPQIEPGDRVVTFEKPKPLPDPIPVKVVREGPDEIVESIVRHEYAQISESRRLLNKNKERSTARITNLSANAADIVWVSPDAGVQKFTGYPIKAGAEFTCTVQTDLWMIADPGASGQIELAVYAEVRIAQ